MKGVCNEEPRACIDEPEGDDRSEHWKLVRLLCLLVLVFFLWRVMLDAPEVYVSPLFGQAREALPGGSHPPMPPRGGPAR